MTNLLTSALPGWRDLRGPLIAGYMWLFFVWLIAEPNAKEHPGGLLQSILDLRGAVSEVGFAVGLSVVAYLAGSVSQAAAAALLKTSEGLGSRADRFRDARGLSLLERVSAAVRRNSGQRPRRASSEIETRPSPEDLVRRRSEASYAKLQTKLPEAKASLPALRSGLKDDRKRLAELREKVKKDGVEDPESRLARAQASRVERVINDRKQRLESVERAITDLEVELNAIRDRTETGLRREIDVPGTLLIEKEDSLYSEADRYRAEGELRLGVCPPLIAIIVVIASREDSALWLLGLVAIVVLANQGVRRIQDARGVIARAIRFGTIRSAALEDFDMASERLMRQAVAVEELFISEPDVLTTTPSIPEHTPVPDRA
jgi:hypothetical protein